MRALLVLVAVCLFPSVSWGDATYDQDNRVATSVAGDTASFSFTCANSNTAMYVAAHIKETSTSITTVADITYGSTLTFGNFTLVGTVTTPTAGTRQLTVVVYRALPGAACTGAAQTLTMRLTVAKLWALGAVTVTGVDQTTPNDALVSQITGGTPLADPTAPAVSSAVGNLVLGFFARQNIETVTALSGETIQYDVLSGGTPDSSRVRGVLTTEPGAASVTSGLETGTNAKEWVAVAFDVNAAVVGPQTYWVAKTGCTAACTDSNSCSAATNPLTAKLTITSGATCLAPGDTLRIKAGTYAEQLTNEIPGGIVSAPVTVMADAGAAVIVQPGDVSGGGAVYFTNAASQYIVLDGLVLDGTAQDEGHGVIVDDDAHHITVRNTEIRNFCNQGILVSNKEGTPYLPIASFNVFSNLEVHDNGTCAACGTNLCHGLYIETDNNLIADSSIFNNTKGHGIQIYSAIGGVQPNDNTITRSYIYNNGTHGVGLYGTTGNTLTNSAVYGNGDTGVIVRATGAEISNCTVSGNDHNGVFLDAGSGHLVRNNIISYNEDIGLWVQEGTGHTLSYNLLFNPTGTNFQTEVGAAHTNTLTSDPLFYDEPNSNFYLQAGSPAINTALDIGLITDCCGTPRPQGAGYDRGVLEFMESTTPRRPTGLQYRFLQLFDRLWRFS